MEALFRLGGVDWVPYEVSMTLLLLSTVLAAKLPEVAVVGLHVEGLSEEDGEQASQLIGEALGRTQAMEFIEPQYASAKLKGREELVLRDMYLKEGQQKLKEGQVLYSRAEPDAAIPMLEDAIEELELGAANTGQTDALIEAWLTLGLAQTGMGEQDAAREAYRQVVVLDPARELDPITYPPDVIQGYSLVRSEVMGEGTGGIRVASEMEGTEVLVDGRPVGAAPVVIKDLPVGRHYVYATAEGGVRESAVVQVVADGMASVGLKLDDRSLGQSAETPLARSAQTEGLYRAVGGYSQTPLVLVGGETASDQVAVFLYSGRSDNFSQALVAPAGDDPVRAITDLIPALGSYVTETGDIRPDRVAMTVPPLDIGDNAVLTQILLDPNEDVQVQYIQTGPKWWVWAGMGGVAVAGAGVGVWALTRSTEPVEAADEGTITVVLPD